MGRGKRRPTVWLGPVRGLTLKEIMYTFPEAMKIIQGTHIISLIQGTYIYM